MHWKDITRVQFLKLQYRWLNISYWAQPQTSVASVPSPHLISLYFIQQPSKRLKVLNLNTSQYKIDEFYLLHLNCHKINSYSILSSQSLTETEYNKTMKRIILERFTNLLIMNQRMLLWPFREHYKKNLGHMNSGWRGSIRVLLRRIL